VDGCIKHPQLAQHISKLHTGLTACIGSSGRVERLLLLAEPPHLDTGEITDKGYINQRKVMERRAAFINRLYADDPEDVVIVAGS
jgi:feruloyl-CoA synthase